METSWLLSHIRKSGKKRSKVNGGKEIQQHTIEIEEEKLNQVQKFEYLESRQSEDGKIKEGNKKRITTGRKIKFLDEKSIPS